MLKSIYNNTDDAQVSEIIVCSPLCFPLYFSSLTLICIFSSPYADSRSSVSQGHLLGDYNLIFIVPHQFTNSQKSAQPSNHNSHNKAIDHLFKDVSSYDST